jgi:hypothetical protein
MLAKLMLVRQTECSPVMQELQLVSQDRVHPEHISQRLDYRCSRACLDVVEEVKTALFAMFFLVGAVSAQAGNLDALKATAKSYVLAIQSALGLWETSSCPQIIAVATEYAKAKIAYYDAARAAMPLLLQSADPLHRGPKQEKLF